MSAPAARRVRPSTHAASAGAATAPRIPRRVSGPARRRAAEPPPRTLRRRATRIGDARLLDRLVRGRAWIAIVGAGLLGVVAMQVTVLRLNAGISEAVGTAETLERSNSVLRAEVSQLGSGERIQGAGATHGLVIPSAGRVVYLDATGVRAGAAARAIKPPAVAPAVAAQAGGPTVQPGTATGVTAPAGVAGPAATATTGAAMGQAAARGTAAAAATGAAATVQGAPAATGAAAAPGTAAAAGTAPATTGQGGPAQGAPAATGAAAAPGTAAAAGTAPATTGQGGPAQGAPAATGAAAAPAAPDATAIATATAAGQAATGQAPTAPPTPPATTAAPTG